MSHSQILSSTLPDFDLDWHSSSFIFVCGMVKLANFGSNNEIYDVLSINPMLKEIKDYLLRAFFVSKTF